MNYYGDSKLLRRSTFSSAGFFGFGHLSHLSDFFGLSPLFALFLVLGLCNGPKKKNTPGWVWDTPPPSGLPEKWEAPLVWETSLYKSLGNKYQGEL